MRFSLQFIVFAVFINSHLYAEALHIPRIKRNAFRSLSRHWPNGIVPYTIGDEYTDYQRGVIYEAMKDIQSVSCIQFKRRSDEEDYVEITKGEGCSAVIGRYGGNQSLTLEDDCVQKVTVIHELFHTLGFFHEHARPDRDEHVKVHYTNVEPDNLKDFWKKSSAIVTSLDLPYDYRSVLHYEDNYFAIDPSQKTLTPIKGNEKFGTAQEMSITDILRLNRLYPCRKNKKRGPWIFANNMMV